MCAEAQLSSPGLRVRRSFSQNVPSPVAFFPSLYSVHNGDFQVHAQPAAAVGGGAGVTHLSGLPRMWALGENWGLVWGPLSVL